MDGPEFIIETDYQFDTEYDIPCRHLKDGKIKAVVIAYNEGGYNQTGVCLECIYEAYKQITEQ